MLRSVNFTDLWGNLRKKCQTETILGKTRTKCVCVTHTCRYNVCQGRMYKFNRIKKEIKIERIKVKRFRCNIIHLLFKSLSKQFNYISIKSKKYCTLYIVVSVVLKKRAVCFCPEIQHSIFPLWIKRTVGNTLFLYIYLTK